MRGTWQTTDGGRGGGTVIAAVIGAIVLAVLVAPALIALIHALAIAVFILLALIVAGAAVFLVFRLRRSHPRAAPAPWRAQVLPGTAQPVAQPRRPALEQPQALHLHFHGVNPQDVAAIIAHHKENQ